MVRVCERRPPTRDATEATRAANTVTADIVLALKTAVERPAAPEATSTLLPGSQRPCRPFVAVMLADQATTP